MAIEARDQSPRPDLTLQAVEDYLSQLKQWDSEVMNNVRSERGVLPRGWETLHQAQMVERANRENPRVLPLIYAELSARQGLAASF